MSRARGRAAKAREARTRILAARLLGVDLSDLTDINVEVVHCSELRVRKAEEQSEYWRRLREKRSPRAVCVDPKRATESAVIHPASFRMFPGSGDGSSA
jgi:hypothetical protein